MDKKLLIKYIEKKEKFSCKYIKFRKKKKETEYLSENDSVFSVIH